MNIEIANHLVALRRDHGLSQEELAAKLGVSRQAVSKWERAESSPDTDNLIALSRLYAVSLDALLLTGGAATQAQTPPPQEQEAPDHTPYEDAPSLYQQQLQWEAGEEDRQRERRARTRRTLLAFPYPVLLTFLYLALGFTLGWWHPGWWHPGWMLYLTVPIYYCKEIFMSPSPFCGKIPWNREGFFMPQTIFLVEDDTYIRGELSALLERYGYLCATTDRFEDVSAQILSSGAHLVLLDVNLPKFDGYHICREVRRVSDIPIIMVTSRATAPDELMSMNLGADDFLTKPYNTDILLARMARLLARAYPTEPMPSLSHKGLTLDLGRGVARYGGQEAELTRNECRILHLLLRHTGQIVGRDALMNELWQSDEFVDDNTLTVNINRLRRKLEAIGAAGLLTTRRGMGYTL